jgi:2-amino-4-hydroxy-6-hydroxymethyldihydropteridine diphosphokinase
MPTESREPRPPIALSLGSNLGNREATLAMARYALGAGGALKILKASSVYETQPVDCSPQPWFLNQVLWVASDLPPALLLAFCQRVETRLGRHRSLPRSPRTLDVDLLFYGDLVVRTPVLTLPHPALHMRRCVLVPLAELGMPWRHPLLGLDAGLMLRACSDPGAVALVVPGVSIVSGGW